MYYKTSKEGSTLGEHFCIIELRKCRAENVYISHVNKTSSEKSEFYLQVIINSETLEKKRVSPKIIN